MTKIDAVLKALRKCQRKLRQLKAGAQLSGQAEGAFTDLADAVEKILIDRRVQEERRGVPRRTPDRRRSNRASG